MSTQLNKKAQAGWLGPQGGLIECVQACYLDFFLTSRCIYGKLSVMRLNDMLHLPCYHTDEKMKIFHFYMFLNKTRIISRQQFLCLERHMASRASLFLQLPPWRARNVCLAPVTTHVPTRKVGLLNLGNTCYMNSVMQALLVARQ